MKRFVLFCIVLSTFGLFAQRLPELARPVNYQLTFAPDFEKNIFSGQETISIQVLKPTSEIVLNAAEIDFLSASITSAGATQDAKVTLDKNKQMATLTVEKALAAGPATIHIRFNGLLNDELRGFYLGKDEQGRKYAVTQFEATDARRAFPSFDEPAYKATFDITVIADKKHVALSNAKVLSDEPGPAAGQHTIKFATSAKMSSYLVAIAVGEFEAVEGEADGIPIRVWGTPGKKQLGSFALAGAESFLHYYNQYFGIKYPFEKLDLIGLPDFEAGAMENTGLITFREALLLIDEQHASIALKHEVADVLSHEMAHMWFGDLVTMQWWDDIWLNEGFATWMSPKPVAAWKPEWHVELDSVRDSIQSQAVDSLQHTRPIQQAAETPEQIQELFDGIAYGKSAAVLRMLEAYIGPESFRAGVNQYLTQHAYGNATATDFWTTLAKASGKPVDEVMPTFVQQAGLPFVAVHAECRGTFYAGYAPPATLSIRSGSIPPRSIERAVAGSGLSESRRICEFRNNVPSVNSKRSALRSTQLRRLDAGKCRRSRLLPLRIRSRECERAGGRCREGADPSRTHHASGRCVGLGAGRTRTGDRLSDARRRPEG